MDSKKYKKFYEVEFHGKLSFSPISFETIKGDSFYAELKKFITDFNLEDKKVLEIGSGNGKFQDIIDDYTGIDISENLKNLYHKPFFTIESEKKYPFVDNSFDAIFTNTVFEHIPDIDNALNEMLRVLKPSGLILFKPAWQVRPWASGGYAVKKYKDLDLKGRLVKLSIILRNNILFRLSYVVPKRIYLMVKFLLNRESMNRLAYKKLCPNYDEFLIADSDACNHIDPYAAILWFMANNCEVLNYPTLLKAFFVRTGSLVIRKSVKAAIVV
ncbi:MAG: class I SAM-dependent methyltransferase [Candidatus Paceibacterota bacterium]